jgi:hypothetical protein
MIDHLAMEVRDYRHSKDFYLAAVAPLGCELLMVTTTLPQDVRGATMPSQRVADHHHEPVPMRSAERALAWTAFECRMSVV